MTPQMRIDRIKGDDIHVQVLRYRIYRGRKFALKIYVFRKIIFFSLTPKPPEFVVPIPEANQG